MLGKLCHYLRLTGHDTLHADTLPSGRLDEDTYLLQLATNSGRLLLTRDKELAQRGGERAIRILADDPLLQIKELLEGGWIHAPLRVRMKHCTICNTLLRPATHAEITSTPYAPQNELNQSFSFCPHCHRLFWMGTHARNLQKDLEGIKQSAGKI
jgi:hypothetical protein